LGHIRIDQHQQHAALTELSEAVAAEERQRPQHRAQRRSARRARQRDAVELGRRRPQLRRRGNRGACADRRIERTRMRLVDAAQPSLAIEPHAIGAIEQQLGGAIDGDDARVLRQHQRRMCPAIERCLRRFRARLFRGELAIESVGPHQVRTDDGEQTHLMRPPLGVVVMVSDRQRGEALGCAVDDHAGGIMPEPARPHELVVVLGLLQLVVANGEFRIGWLSDRQAMRPREIRTRLGVMLPIGAQIVLGEIAPHRQRMRRGLSALVAEQRDAAVGIDALERRDELVPMLRIGRRLVEMPHEIEQLHGLEVRHPRHRSPRPMLPPPRSQRITAAAWICRSVQFYSPHRQAAQTPGTARLSGATLYI